MGDRPGRTRGDLVRGCPGGRACAAASRRASGQASRNRLGSCRASRIHRDDVIGSDDAARRDWEVESAWIERRHCCWRQPDREASNGLWTARHRASGPSPGVPRAPRERRRTATTDAHSLGLPRAALSALAAWRDRGAAHAQPAASRRPGERAMIAAARDCREPICYSRRGRPCGAAAMEAGRDSDDAAILEVIEEETAAYLRKDFAAWARCWVHGPHVRRGRGIRTTAIHLSEGWDAESAAMRRGLEQLPVPNASLDSVRRDRVSLRIGADMAWATFDQHATTTGDPLDLGRMQRQLRILEKQDGVWKIACISTLEPWLPGGGLSGHRDRRGRQGVVDERPRHQGVSRLWPDDRRRTLARRDRTGNKALQAAIRGRRARPTT